MQMFPICCLSMRCPTNVCTRRFPIKRHIGPCRDSKPSLATSSSKFAFVLAVLQKKEVCDVENVAVAEKTFSVCTGCMHSATGRSLWVPDMYHARKTKVPSLPCSSTHAEASSSVRTRPCCDALFSRVNFHCRARAMASSAKEVRAFSRELAHACKTSWSFPWRTSSTSKAHHEIVSYGRHTHSLNTDPNIGRNLSCHTAENGVM